MNDPAREKIRETIDSDFRAGNPKKVEEYEQIFADRIDEVRTHYASALSTFQMNQDSHLTSSFETARPIENALAKELGKIGHYDLIEELGRGGQGAVYRALDNRLNRAVALKVILTRFTNSASVRERFLREAVSAARLNHPGICPVHEYGESDGVPFIAMPLIEGQTLREMISRKDLSEPEQDTWWSAQGETVDSESSPREEDTNRSHNTTSAPSEAKEIDAYVKLIAEAARALHVAHEAGMVHRDVKPGNIMVRSDRRAIILDFGLVQDDLVDSDESQGGLMGTPSYMSPEQLTPGALTIDRRTDVYSLGVTLYECLTSQRPYSGPTREALYQSILMKPATSARKLNSAISRDLEIVIETAIDKDRDLRYQTALDFAEDLRRVLDRELIAARPISPLLRARRWSQRNPVVAAVSAVVFVALISGLALTLTLLNAEARERQAKTTALEEVEEKQTELKKQLLKSKALSRTLEANQALPVNPGRAFRMAVEADRMHSSFASRSMLVKALDRTYETATINMAEYELQSPTAVAVSGNGQMIACGSLNGTILIVGGDGVLVHRLDAHTGIIRSLRFFRGDLLVSTGSDGTARIWDSRSGQQLLSAAQVAYPEAFTLSRDQRSFATVAPDGGVMVQQIDGRGERVLLETPEEFEVSAVALDPLMRSLAVGSLDGDVLVYSLSDRKAKPRRFFRSTGPIRSLTMTLDGQQLIVQDLTETILYDLQSEDHDIVARWPSNRCKSTPNADGSRWLIPMNTGFRIVDSEFSARTEVEDQSSATAFCQFFPDGRRFALVASGPDRGSIIQIWGTDGESPIDLFMGHDEQIVDLSISKDGRHLASVAEDGTCKVWSFGGLSDKLVDANAQRRWTLAIPSSPIVEDTEKIIGFGPDDNSVFLIDSQTGALMHSVRLQEGNVHTASWDNSREHLLIGTSEGEVLIHDAIKRTTPIRFKAHESEVCDAAFVGDGAQIMTVSIEGNIALWDAKGNEIKKASFPISVEAALFSRDHGYIVLMTLTELIILNAESLAEMARTSTDGDGFSHIALSPSGAVYFGTRDGVVGSFAPPFSKKSVLSRHFGEVTDIACLPLLKCIVSGASDGTLHVTSDSGENTRTISGFGGAVMSLRLSKDQRSLLVCSTDGTMRVIEAGSWESRLLLGGQAGKVGSAVFADNGNRILATTGAGQLTCWDLDSGQQVIQQGARFSGYRLSKGGKGLVAASPSRRLKEKFWRVSAGKRSAWTFWKEGVRRPWFSIEQLEAKVSASSARGGSQSRMARSRPTMFVERRLSAKRGLVMRGNSLDILDLDSMAVLSVLKLDSSLRDAAFSSNGEFVATVSGAGELALWRCDTGSKVKSLPSQSSMTRIAAISLDGSMVVTVSDDVLESWDTNVGARLSRNVREWRQRNLYQVNADHRLATTPHSEHGVQVFDLNGKKETVSFMPEFANKKTSPAESGLRNALASDGRFLVVEGDGVLHIVDPASGESVSSLKTGKARAWVMEFDKKSNKLAAFFEDGRLVIWDLATQQRYMELNYQLAGRRVANDARTKIRMKPTSMEFTADGKWLILGLIKPVAIPLEPRAILESRGLSR